MESLLTQRPLLTAAETASLLGISRQTVWRWGAEGRLAAVRLGPNTVRYRAASIELLLQGNEQGQVPPLHNDHNNDGGTTHAR